MVPRHRHGENSSPLSGASSSVHWQIRHTLSSSASLSPDISPACACPNAAFPCASGRSAAASPSEDPSHLVPFRKSLNHSKRLMRSLDSLRPAALPEAPARFSGSSVSSRTPFQFPRIKYTSRVCRRPSRLQRRNLRWTLLPRSVSGTPRTPHSRRRGSKSLLSVCARVRRGRPRASRMRVHRSMTLASRPSMLKSW